MGLTTNITYGTYAALWPGLLFPVPLVALLAQVIATLLSEVALTCGVLAGNHGRMDLFHPRFVYFNFAAPRGPFLGWAGPIPPQPAAAETGITAGRAGAAVAPPERKAKGRRKEGELWTAIEARRRAAVLERFRAALWRDPSTSTLGRQLSSAAGPADEKQTVEDAFWGKSTATLELRFSSLSLFERWAALAYPGRRLPLEEPAP